jgi:hypothetical protein
MITLKREDYHFLLLSMQFCNRVDEYMDLLGLEASVVGAYKFEHAYLRQLITDKESYGPDVDYFVAETIENMKVAFYYLVMLCKCNENYTLTIGKRLGIEKNDDESFFTISPN